MAYEGVVGGIRSDHDCLSMGERLPEGSLLAKCLWNYNSYIVGDEIIKTHLDLFSGIGGFALACKWAGIETIQFVEIDPFCQKVLQKNFPGVPIHDNIKTYHWTEEYRPFILTGGFPCQPFSVAGKQLGKEDDRYLWTEMFRVIKEAKPHWVLAENVAGIVNMVLDEVLADLESEDYETGTVIIPACAKNAPHRRDRVWIIAHNKCLGWKERTRERIQSEIKIAEGPNIGDINTERAIANPKSGESREQTTGNWGEGFSRGSCQSNQYAISTNTNSKYIKEFRGGISIMQKGQNRNTWTEFL